MRVYFKWFLLLFVLNCENPIDVNPADDLSNVDPCIGYDVESCGIDELCQLINSACVSIDSYKCTINFGGVIDDCGLCSSGTTNLIPNQNKNICGECFGEEINDEISINEYDHDNDINTPELFCGCSNLNSAQLTNDGCCGIIGNNNYFKDNSGITCNPDDLSITDCNNTVVRDACGICGGDNSVCSDCLGIPNGNAIIDDCGVCNGNDFFQDGLLSDGSCDCLGNILDECGVCNGNGIQDGLCDCNGNVLDCNEECGGTAIFDCTGTCGGDTILDCDGVCGGNVLIQEGNCDCDGNSIAEGQCDCDGNILDCFDVCGGDSIEDCLGICGGSAVEDCFGVCQGTAVLDECGVCNGDGILEGECDCNGNFLDECQVCGGSAVKDCLGICGGDAIIDDCGICDGQNLSKDMCNICFGDNTECLQGILTLEDWFFDFKSIWPNSECSGPINYNYYNYICINQVCYDYTLIFNEDFSFDFIIQSWDENSDCDWLFDSQNCLNISTTFLSGNWSLNINQVSPLLINGNILCLDYEPENLEDFCFDNISLLNNYETCINDSHSCDNNIMYLSLSNDNQCYQEQFSTEGYINSHHSDNNINTNEFSIINQNIIKVLQKDLYNE